MRAASLLKTGSTPGKAMSTAHAWVFGGAPYFVDAPENALLLLSNCACTSRPITHSHSILIEPFRHVPVPIRHVLITVRDIEQPRLVEIFADHLQTNWQSLAV